MTKNSSNTSEVPEAYSRQLNSHYYVAKRRQPQTQEKESGQMSDEKHMGSASPNAGQTEQSTQPDLASFQMPFCHDDPPARKNTPRTPNSFDTFRSEGAPMSVETPQQHGESYVATVYREGLVTGRYPVAFVQVDELEESLCVHVVVRGYDTTVATAQIRASLEYALGTYKQIIFPQ